MTQVLPNREQIPKKGCYPHGLAWRMVYNHTDRDWMPRLDKPQQDIRHGASISGRCRPLNRRAYEPVYFCSQYVWLTTKGTIEASRLDMPVRHARAS